MAEAPRISEAGWEVMKVVWARSPLTANEVCQALSARKDWSHRTVKTLLGRLVRKGAMTFKPQGNRYLYRPRVTKDQCVHMESESFRRRVFGGQAASMLVHLVRS
ncbi:MAG TPA: BlaI/MecI/CopY family transcriptional regulator, partial [Anaerolineae bacterium]|nr:BlaI/MecI/CopY family transcriptional regulator [Anaerolineae bacterium]